jgi:hypothetical protein
MMFPGYIPYPDPNAPGSHSSNFVHLGQESQYPDAEPELTPEQAAQKKAQEDFAAVAPNCHCGQKAATLQVKKEGPNKGRWFYGCPKRQEEGRCSTFFRFADTAGQVGTVVAGNVRNNALTDIIAANQERLLTELQNVHKKLDALMNFCDPRK